MIVFGVVFTTLGAMLPTIIASFGLDKRAAGALLSLLSFTVLAGSLVFGPIVDRRGYKSLLLVSFAVISLGLETIAFAPSLGWLRTGVVLIGFAGALLNGAANALIVDVSPGRRIASLAFMSSFFGVGAAGVPIVLSLLGGRISHASILAAIGVFVALPLVLTARASFPLGKHADGRPISAARSLLRDPALVIMGFMLFLESGMESTVGGWTTTFFVEVLDVSVERSPLYLGFFWLGLLVARFVIGLTLKDSQGLHALLGGIGTALLSALWLVATRSVGSAAIAVFLLGCGFAPVFPVVLGVIGDRYARLSGTALSIAFGMALTGGMLMPYTVGVIANARGLRGAFVLVPVALVLMGVLLTTVSRVLSRIGEPKADADVAIS
jgi:fucose permease